jgi:hypothetical protein
MPTMRFAQRLTEGFNVRVKTLIKIEPTNSNNITNNNSGVATIGPVFASEDFSTTGSLKRYASPFKRLNIPATHNTARMILTSSRFLTVSLLAIMFISFLDDIDGFLSHVVVAAEQRRQQHGVGWRPLPPLNHCMHGPFVVRLCRQT